MVMAAVRLAEWIGADGRPVTDGAALRPADVPDAARVVGASVPLRKVRRAADVPEVHRPWLVAVGAGLIAVADKRAVQAGKLDEPLAAWWAGLQALLIAEAADTFATDPRVTALVTLTSVTERRHDGRALARDVEFVMDERGDWDYWAPQRHGHRHPAEAALDVLRVFGVLDGTRLTPLGAWAEQELRRVVPPPITPGTPVADLLRLLADGEEADLWDRACRWFGDRTVELIVTELCECAAEAAPAERVTAVELISALGDEAVAVFRAAERFPGLAPHVRSLAHQYEVGSALSLEDRLWLATEHAHADLTRHGAAAARYAAMDFLDVAEFDRIAGGGHPRAKEVSAALAAVTGPVPVQQLKVALSGQCWRRVLLPENATLGLLHRVIIALFGWDDDHLHVFTVDRRRYADPYYELEETASEDAMPLYRALPKPGARISHMYDFGASHRHEITLEKVLGQHPLVHPECLTGKGDNPVEYYDPDDPVDPEPLDVGTVNERLRRLVR
jgi:hypothetical protein